MDYSIEEIRKWCQDKQAISHRVVEQLLDQMERDSLFFKHLEKALQTVAKPVEKKHSCL